MRYARFLLPSLAVAASVVTSTPVRAANGNIVLTRDGRAMADIVLARDAIPAERTAAAQLKDYLHQITGASFQIQDETAALSSGAHIFIGPGTHARKLAPQIRWNSLGPDSIVIKTSGKDLILAGDRPRGSLYAVFRFLEKQAGVRWWTPEATTVPKTKSFVVGPQNTVYTPVFRTREAFYASPIADPLFATRLGLNGQYMTQGAELGGHDSIVGWVHTFEHLLPIEKYFKQHPEWYSDAANGGKPCTAASPQPTSWQLCLTDEAARHELTRNALQWLHDHPDATMISISQNDNKLKCTADADAAIEAEEQSPSGPLLRFVNAVAVDIEKQYPHVLVETLAYQYTRKPPAITRPRRNVIIRLCSIEADFAHPLHSEANAEFRNDLLGWKAIAPRLYVWDYVANFANVIFPHPNLRVIGPNIKFFAANHVVALFEQGDAYSNQGGDFADMRTWVMSQLLWDPALDQRKLEDEFLSNYYGPAGPHLRQYLDIIQEAFARSGGRLWVSQSDNSYLTLNVMNQATGAFQAAAQAVQGNPDFSARVSQAKLSFDNAWLIRYKALYAQAQKTGQPFLGPKDPQAFARDFVDRARTFKIKSSAEGQPFEIYANSVLARFTPPAPLPAFLGKVPAENLIDAQEGDFRLSTMPNQSAVIADDAKASNGKAASMPGFSKEWLIQYPLSVDKEFLGDSAWHGYAAIRVDVKPGTRQGPAFSYGLYDTANHVTLSNEHKTLADLPDDNYVFIDLGTHKLHPGIYVFVAPEGNAEINFVNVDRIIFVREP